MLQIRLHGSLQRSFLHLPPFSLSLDVYRTPLDDANCILLVFYSLPQRQDGALQHRVLEALLLQEPFAVSVLLESYQWGTS